MKLLFSKASDPTRKNFPIPFTLMLDKNGTWGFMGETYNQIPEYITAIGRGLLLFGIKDFQYLYPDPSPDDPQDKVRIDFFFEGSIEKYQFQALVLGNEKKESEYTIPSNSKEEAHYKAQQIHHFVLSNDITASIYQVNPLTIKVVTSNLLDHIAIAIQNEKGSFNKPSANEVMFNGYFRPFLEPLISGIYSR